MYGTIWTRKRTAVQSQDSYSNKRRQSENKSQERKKQGKGKALRKQIPLTISDVLQKHCTIQPIHFFPLTDT